MRHRLLEEIDGCRSFILILDAGEEVVAALSRFAGEVGLAGGSLTGIGALSRAELGWFNPATKEFRKNIVDEQAEVLSIIGNIAQSDTDEDDGDGDAGTGNIRLHIHIALGCRDASVRGGHLVSGLVSPTMELIIEESAAHLTRGFDAATGLVLLEPHRAETRQAITKAAQIERTA